MWLKNKVKGCNKKKQNIFVTVPLPSAYSNLPNGRSLTGGGAVIGVGGAPGLNEFLRLFLYFTC